VKVNDTKIARLGHETVLLFVEWSKDAVGSRESERGFPQCVIQADRANSDLFCNNFYDTEHLQVSWG
jgi:hypothetical protein